MRLAATGVAAPAAKPAAPAAAGVLTHPHALGSVALAFVAFCLTASGGYFLNDLRDA